MVIPALLAIAVPILAGLILGPTGVVGVLGGVSVTGFAMAVFMSNAGAPGITPKSILSPATTAARAPNSTSVPWWAIRWATPSKTRPVPR